MADTEYLKCACKECGNNIEFPPSIKRTTIVCPHCGQWTELIPPGKEEQEDEERAEGGLRIGLVPLIGCVVLLLVAIAGVTLFLRHKPAHPETATVPKPPPKVAAVAPVPKPTAPAPKPTNTLTQVAATNSPPRPKSADDLKVGTIELQKTKGSSLVYAVGTLTNDSEYERFGVRINLDLLNKKGNKIGTATDYAESLTPHQEWQFHALVTDPKTADARVVSVKED